MPDIDKLVREKVAAASVVALMKDLVGEKYRLIIAYVNYGDQLRCFERDGIHSHFATHIEEERELAYELAKHLTALDEDAPAKIPEVREVKLDHPRDVFEEILRLEEKSLDLWTKLFEETSQDVALNGLAQEGAVKDRQHIDDMKRYLRTK